MCLFKKQRKIKKFGKIANEMFHNFYNDGRLCGKGVTDKGRIEDWTYEPKKDKTYSTYTFKITDGSLPLTFTANYFFDEDCVSVWVSPENHKNQTNYKKYLEGKYRKKPFSVGIYSYTVDIGLSKMPAKDEHEICEAIHKFRIAWQESDLHKLFTKLAVTEYTYIPKDFHDYD
ncbi:MAG: hypothetical protein IJ996_04425 [Clostridia bacterium]|nr:hypothetical protein [Clostridia bacterium]